MSEGRGRRAVLRLLLALAVVALAVFLWNRGSGAPRTPAGRAARKTPSEAAARGETADAEAAGAGEEEGCGEEERAYRYRVTVVSRRDGSPIAGAKVVSEDSDCQATTGADGVAEFRAENTHWWSASAPGFFSVDVDFDIDGNGWVALPPATIVTGKVIDAATRRPILGAEVRLWAMDPGLDYERAETDEAGRFEVAGALRQGFRLIVQADGYCPAETEGTLAGPLRGLEIALAAGATLQGHVFRADGAPMSGARVFLMAGGEEVPNLVAYSGEEGDYTLSGVPLGVELVPWTAPEFRVATLVAHGDAVAFREAGEVQERDISLRALATLTVTGRGPDGETIRLSHVALEDQGHAVWPRSRSEDWTFEAPPGRYQLTVRPDGWPALRREIVLDALGTREEIVFSKGLALEGTALATDGAPLPADIYWWNGTLGSSAKADAAGRFRIAGLPAAAVDLLVSAPDHVDATREGVEPGGPPLVIRLQPAARITGLVVGHARNRVLYAKIWSQGSTRNCDRLEDDGRFEFVLDRVGEPVTLAFRRDLEAPIVLSLPSLAAGEVRDVGEIRFDLGRTVRGRVVGVDGKPAVGAFVDLAEAWCQEGDPLSTRTDETGRFCLLRMPRAAFWVRVDMEGYPPHFLRVEEDTVELRLTTGGVAEGRGEASFRLSGLSDWADNATVDATPDADGSYSVRLQPGEYRGWTEDEGGKTVELLPFVIREGEATRVKVKPR